jgi:Metallopeptidase family M24
MAVAFALAGLLIAFIAPRHRQLAAAVVAGLVPLLVFAAVIVFGPLSILAAAAAVAVASAAAILLARAAHRAVVAPFLFAALVGFVPLLANRPVQLGLVVAVFLFALALTIRHVDLALRLACAALGALLVLLAIPVVAGSFNRPAWAAVTLLFLVAPTLAMRRSAASLWRDPPRPRRKVRWRRLWAAAAGVGAAGFVLVCSFVWLAAELPAPSSPRMAARLAAVEQRAPAGGLVWPLPSEALFWDEPIARDELPRFDNLDARWLTGLPLRGLYRLPGTSVLGVFSLHGTLLPLRIVKDAEELVALRFAAQATVEGVRDVLPLIRPGVKESELASALSAAFKRRGCEGDSFPPLVTSGAAAAAPHGDGNRGVLRKGELLVLDVGCYKDHYASDFTRTFPIGGTFTEEQRRSVRGVLAAQAAALALCKPGVSMFAPAGTPSLSRAAADALEASGLPRTYKHTLGHPVGLFVHDVDDHEPLRPGSVITLEPGQYVDGAFGVRIEDTFVVRESDCAPLTDGMPADPEAIEALLASRP